MTDIRSSTRAKLFDAAETLIGQQGLHATTVEQIVELAGVAKGTVYYHFKGKNELFQALLVEGLNRLAGAVRDQVEAASGPVAALEGVVRAEVENIAKYEAFARLMMSQLWQADSLWGEEALSILHDEIIATIQRVVKEGQSRGDFREDLDASMAAPVIFGMVATAVLGMARKGSSPVSEESSRQLLVMALGTVRAGS